MIAVAGGILIVLAVLAAAGVGFTMLDVNPGCGWALLAGVALFVLFVIF